MAINRIVHLLTKQTGRLAALVVVLGFYAMARLPEVSNTERAELAGRFQFERFTLPDLPQYAHREVRNVSPQLQHISAWISAVGASVAMNDLDGDGLPNDVCWVDTRIDKVIVAPAPGTPSRYAPLVLEPVPLPYDTITMAPMGCLPLDANEDGSIDVIVYYWGRTPIAFLRYGSAYIPREVYPTAERWFTNAATSADADGDGHVDLIFGNYFPDGARILDPTSDDDEAMQRSMSR
ncbi:MAG TPA: hypothetical protein VN285_02600, partial [Candidatus Deferrimicrobium sp.]|nr:hypothetical protein [Candidatus Deferrimicrobium sp.]